MGQIVIYHNPQECGNPFFMVLDSVSGKVTQTIDLPSPSGYYYDGYEIVYQRDLLGKKREKRLTSQLPNVGDEERFGVGKINGKRCDCRVVKKVEAIKDEYLNDLFLYHECYVTYEYYGTHTEKKWDSSKDEYRKEMERLGFDMSKWHVYNRRKVAYKDFLRSLFPNALNMVFVG